MSEKTSSAIDLIMDARRALSASTTPAAALCIRRLRRNPTAPDAVVWFATAQELDRQGHDVQTMTAQKPTADPSLVGSILADCEHYPTPSEVTVC